MVGQVAQKQVVAGSCPRMSHQQLPGDLDTELQLLALKINPPTIHLSPYLHDIHAMRGRPTGCKGWSGKAHAAYDQRPARRRAHGRAPSE
eukprot:1610630-Pyramimonas_sp.AAC.1